MSKASQASKLIEYMEKHDNVTALDALSALGIMRLGARIYDLRRAGYEIKTTSVRVPTREGSAVVAGYSLVSAEEVG